MSEESLDDSWDPVPLETIRAVDIRKILQECVDVGQEVLDAYPPIANNPYDPYLENALEKLQKFIDLIKEKYNV